MRGSTITAILFLLLPHRLLLTFLILRLTSLSQRRHRRTLRPSDPSATACRFTSFSLTGVGPQARLLHENVSLSNQPITLGWFISGTISACSLPSSSVHCQGIGSSHRPVHGSSAWIPIYASWALFFFILRSILNSSS